MFFVGVQLDITAHPTPNKTAGSAHHSSLRSPQTQAEAPAAAPKPKDRLQAAQPTTPLPNDISAHQVQSQVHLLIVAVVYVMYAQVHTQARESGSMVVNLHLELAHIVLFHLGRQKVTCIT